MYEFTINLEVIKTNLAKIKIIFNKASSKLHAGLLNSNTSKIIDINSDIH